MQEVPAGNKRITTVEHDDALASCLTDLAQQTAIALDLEFDSHSFAYGTTLGLIQIATPAACYLIDPLADIDLNPLYDLLEDERILKIMHSPGEDLRLLHSLDCYPQNIFDTEVVVKLLNYEATSLAAALQEHTGHVMSKQQQRSNWLLRPLSPEQVLYAADDVAWLHQLKNALVGEAASKGLSAFVQEEQDALSTTIHQQEVKTSFLKGGDLRTMSPYDQYVLNELFIFRDGLAQERNKPAYKVMDEALIRGLAGGELQPDDLIYAKGLHGALKNERFADKVSARMETARSAAERDGLSRELPERTRMSSEDRAARARADRDRDEKFAPVQEALSARFGTFAGRFILSNGVVNDILKHSMGIGDIKRSYKQELIRSTAAGLDIDLSEYDAPVAS